jgi:trans-aconitate 2-methyltransferase
MRAGSGETAGVTRGAPGYAFGDSDLAAARLMTLARVFGPSSEAFVSSCAPHEPDLAVDLGCGPGATTRMLARATGARRTVGLDISVEHVGRAVTGAGPSPASTGTGTGPGTGTGTGTGTGSVAFAVHDVTEVPFPCGPADVVFARYLVSHLPDPAAVVAGWAGQLRPGGVLLVEEVDSIDTEIECFRTYLEMVAALMAATGGGLYVGADLAAWPDPPCTERISARLAAVRPRGADVVAIFRSNLAVWRRHPWAQERWTLCEVDELDRRLAAQVDLRSGAITWRLRQLAWRALPGRPGAGA